MFIAKLKDGKQVEVSLENLEKFFEENGDNLQSQPKKFPPPRRGDCPIAC
jgi:hypothetical protein